MQPLEVEEPSRQTAAAAGYGTGRAALILTAECVGTGVLALPGCAWTLGAVPFVALVLAQVALNVYAGSMLATAAEVAERKASYAACEETTTPLREALSFEASSAEEEAVDAVVFASAEASEFGEASPPPRPRDFVELASLLEASRGVKWVVGTCWYGNLVLITAQYLVVMARSLRLALDLGPCPAIAGVGEGRFLPGGLAFIGS